MGLIFDTDIEAWARWQSARRRLMNPLRLLRKPTPPPFFLSMRGQNPRLLIGLDAVNPTSVASLLTPLASIEPAAVLSTQDIAAHLPGQPSDWTTERIDGDAAQAFAAWRPTLDSVSIVLSTGHFLPVGAAALQWSQQLGALFVIVQHGLITPFAPPLPAEAHLLAFSDADAQFWASGRTDITTHVVGSQLLWKAQQSRTTALVSEVPVFLGQLHGAELARSLSATTAGAFCRAVGATYRPHPSEKDILSRVQHARWARQGIVVDSSPRSLMETPRPVVSIFSTGVLEAAAAGIPAWVTIARPVTWVSEFWDRYGMAPWGSTPTPPPPAPPEEPARAIAALLDRLAGSKS